MPGSHANISPSAAHRWINCPPSVRLNLKFKDVFGEQTSVYAEEGTKAHALAELKLRRANKEINDFRFSELVKELGDIPAEMKRATDDYVDVVLEEYGLAKASCPDAQLLIEQKLDMTEWIPECWGTSDAVIVSDNILVVMDLKYGSGVPVSAVGNPQARIYALGAIAEFGALYGFDTVKEMIIQPRLDSITEETISRKALIEWAEKEVIPAAKLASKGEGEFHSGDWCRFCSVRPICKENVLKGFDVLKNITDAPEVLSDDRICALLPFLDTAEEWIKSVRDYVRSSAINGKQWKGYKLVRGRRPGRKWTNPDEVINTLARAGYTREQYMTEPELRSCSELEKIIKKPAFEAFCSAYVSQGEGALSLVPESDKREAYSPVEESFGDLLGGTN